METGTKSTIKKPKEKKPSGKTKREKEKCEGKWRSSKKRWSEGKIKKKNGRSQSLSPNEGIKGKGKRERERAT